METLETEDIVNVLLQKAFHSFSYSAKLATKERGRPLPKIKVTRSNGNVSVVSATWFARYAWLTGSITSNRLYCWPCLLMNNSKSPTWAVHGFTDAKNLDRATKRHDKCEDHVGAAIRLSLLGTMPIDQVVDEGVRLQIQQHNAKVRGVTCWLHACNMNRGDHAISTIISNLLYNKHINKKCGACKLETHKAPRYCI